MESKIDHSSLPAHKTGRRSVVAWLPNVKHSLEELNAELSRTDGDIQRLRCQEEALSEHDFVVMFQRLSSLFATSAGDEARLACCNTIVHVVDLQLQCAGLMRWSLIWQQLSAVLLDVRNTAGVQYNLLTVVKMLCQHLLPDLALALSADSVVRNLLENTSAHHHQILELCTEIKTTLVVHIPAVQMSQYRQDFALLWQTLRRHPDARSRMIAYVLLYQLTQSIHHRPDVDLYSQLVQGFSDPSEQIRRLCIHLAIYFARSFPDFYVSSSASQEEAEKSRRADRQNLMLTTTEEKIRLADDAFAKTCDLVNDVEPAVRLDAITALSLMSEGVSEVFIMQTLEKKLMSNMRSKATAHDRQKELFDSGEWVSGKKWTTDAPRGDMQAGRLTLLPMRACGSFIHALEDELKIVRSAAVDSIVLIARYCVPFAIKSVDFVIDMFNDEIELVRQKAIQALSLLFRFVNTDADDTMMPMTTDKSNYTSSRNQLRLRPDQLEIVLAVLQESSRDIRTALLHTVPRLAYINNECLIIMLNAFLQNLQRNPTDLEAVCESLKIAGIKQHDFVVELFDRLMQIHPYLDTPEPNLDDHNYVATVVLVTNACAVQPNRLVHRFPKFFGKHYSYMNYRYPDWVPHIDHFSRLLHSKSTKQQQALAPPTDNKQLGGNSGIKREKTPPADDEFLLTSKRIKLEAENGPPVSVAMSIKTPDLEDHDDSVAISTHLKLSVAQIVSRLSSTTDKNNSLNQQQAFKQITCLTNDCRHVINVGAPSIAGVANFLMLSTELVQELVKMQSSLSSSRAAAGMPSDSFALVRKLYAESAELLTVFTGLSMQEKYWMLENHFLLAVLHSGGNSRGEDRLPLTELPAALVIKRENVEIDVKEIVSAEEMVHTKSGADPASNSDDAEWRKMPSAKLSFMCAALLKLVIFIHANKKSLFLQLSAVGIELGKHSPVDLLASSSRGKLFRTIIGAYSIATPHIFFPSAGLAVLRKTAKLTVEQSSAVSTIRTGGAAVNEASSRPITSSGSSISVRPAQVHEFAESLAMHLDIGIELRGFDGSDSNTVTANLCVVVDYPDGRRDITFINAADVVDTDAVLNGRGNGSSAGVTNDLTKRLFAYSKEEDERKLRQQQQKSRQSGLADDPEAPKKATAVNIRRRIYLWHESWSNAVHVTIFVALSSEFAELALPNSILPDTKGGKNEHSVNTGLSMTEKSLLMPISDKERLLVRPRKS